MANTPSLLFDRDVNGEGNAWIAHRQKQGKGCYGASNEICRGVDVFEVVRVVIMQCRRRRWHIFKNPFFCCGFLEGSDGSRRVGVVQKMRGDVSI